MEDHAMMYWLRIGSFAFALALIGVLPASAQPGRRGGSDGSSSIKQIEAELADLLAKAKSLQQKLESAKQKDKGKGDEKGKRGFGPKGGLDGFGPMGGFGRGFGPKDGPGGKMQGKDERGQQGSARSREEAKPEGKRGFGPMGGPWGRMQGKGREMDRRSERGQKESPRPHFGPRWGDRRGTGRMPGRDGFGPMGGPWGRGEQSQRGPSRSNERPNTGSIERKLDQIQRDLKEIRRELRRRR